MIFNLTENHYGHASQSNGYSSSLTAYWDSEEQEWTFGWCKSISTYQFDHKHYSTSWKVWDARSRNYIRSFKGLLRYDSGLYPHAMGHL